MRFTALFYLCFVLCFSHVAKTHADSNHPSAPPQAGQTWVGATIDLTTQSGVELVKGCLALQRCAARTDETSRS